MPDEEQEGVHDQNIDSVEETQDTPSLPEPDKNWVAARNVMSEQKAEIDALKRQIENLQQSTEKEDDYDPHDYLTYEKFDKVASKKMKKLEDQLQATQKKFQYLEHKQYEDKMRLSHDDYDYVMDNFGLPMVKENPKLAEAIRSCENWAEMAYNMAKSTPEYQKAVAKQQADPKKAERVLKNTQRPTSATAAASGMKQQADYFANLSPEEVWKKSQEYAQGA